VNLAAFHTVRCCRYGRFGTAYPPGSGALCSLGNGGRADKVGENMGFRIVSAVLTVIVAGCAWQSGVQKLGDGKYQVSANASPARGGETGARSMALSAANKQCDSLGKKIDVTDVEISHAFPANGVATVTFFCR
jgi:hypothetical protein